MELTREMLMETVIIKQGIREFRGIRTTATVSEGGGIESILISPDTRGLEHITLPLGLDNCDCPVYINIDGFIYECEAIKTEYTQGCGKFTVFYAKEYEVDF